MSLEIYLAHMMVFRMIEKAGLTRIAGELILSYLIVCGLIIMGIVFAITYQWCEKMDGEAAKIRIELITDRIWKE